MWPGLSRCAAQAVQAGDAEIAADTNAPQSFRHGLENFSRGSQDGVYPYGASGPNVSFALIARAWMTAKAMHLPFARLTAAIERHNAFADDPVMLRGGWRPVSYLRCEGASDLQTAPL